MTLAPGVTFWDAGELIAAAHVLGIPHPPGTPVYVMLGHTWSSALAPLLGVARAMNLLSACCTALAGAAMAWLVARRSQSPHAGWIGLGAALCAGTMMSVWSNATETEVYAVSLLHAVVMLVAASRVGDADWPERSRNGERWLLVTAYLIALAPAVHLSALVAAPAAIVLAGRDHRGGGTGPWQSHRIALLGGALVAAAGIGRVSAPMACVGIVIAISSFARRRGSVRGAAELVVLVALATSALAMLLVRARHDPPINQGDPSTVGALLDMVARRQYDVASILPRQAPVWWQAANLVQYVDWQAAMSWGSGVVTSPARVIAAVVWLALGWEGFRALRRVSPALADALAMLFLCGTAGVAAYLNLKVGASLGWGWMPDRVPHEARERDYFFVLGFWAWGCLAGSGAVMHARSRGWPASVGLLAAMLPLAGNWASADRSREPTASAAHRLAESLLASTPRGGVLFVDGDNDSYPLWYLQQVEGVRRDVLTVTIPLLPASWYPAELSRRSGLRWTEDRPAPGAQTISEQRASVIAAAAHRAGHPVVASPTLPSRERALLGGDWVMRGPVYVAGSRMPGGTAQATVDRLAAARWMARERTSDEVPRPEVDPVVRTMLSLLQCPRLGVEASMPAMVRDSLEVKCNLR
ncbi:MAG: DUF2723 domain-containing protein [Gemmatimonadaceae bacterium]